jgi:DMSO reductase anchor subunit
MLIILPLVLFIVMTELSVGSVIVLVLLDWRNEVKRGFLISYALIYLVLGGLTYLVQQNFSTPQLLDTFARLDKAWIPYESLPLLLFFLLLIPYSALLLVDKSAGVDGKKPVAQAQGEHMEVGEVQVQPRASRLRILRLIVGAAIIAAGVATLFVMAMIYRPLADAHLGGVFTVAGFFAAALALGGVLTAMWLGHWYLVTPALSERPLQFAITLVLLGVLAQLIFSFIAGPATANASAQGVHKTGPVINSTVPSIAAATPTPKEQLNAAGTPLVTPLSVDAIGWIRILVSFIMPLILGGLAWKLVHDRSFQSATGMLYLVVVCSLAGEAIARGLFLASL